MHCFVQIYVFTYAVCAHKRVRCNAHPLTWQPMDLQTMVERVNNSVYDTVTHFRHDLKLITDNCKLYNGESTPYYKCALKIEVAVETLCQAIFSDTDLDGVFANTPASTAATGGGVDGMVPE